MKTKPLKTMPWWKSEGVLGEVYQTKKAIEQAVRAVVNAAPLNTPLPERDAAWLLDLLKHHPEWDTKEGMGVAGVEVRMNIGEHFANRGLWLTRFDGTDVDISWPTAVNAKARSQLQMVREAARHAIVDQVRLVRDTFLGEPCPICGRGLDTTAHVDHKAPITFEFLLQEWLSSVGGADAIAIDDAGLHAVFGDAGQARGWWQFHYWFAELRLIHAHENLGKVA